MNNKEMASIFFNTATLLRSREQANPYRIAAYERCGRALMGLRVDLGGVSEHTRVDLFHRRQHIGKGLHAKMTEMAVSGDLLQYAEMLAELPEPVANLVRVPGVGPKTAERVYRSLGVDSAAGLVRAARDGRLRRVRGFGEKRTRTIAALEIDGVESPRAAVQASLFDGETLSIG